MGEKYSPHGVPRVGSFSREMRESSCFVSVNESLKRDWSGKKFFRSHLNFTSTKGEKIYVKRRQTEEVD